MYVGWNTRSYQASAAGRSSTTWTTWNRSPMRMAVRGLSSMSRGASALAAGEPLLQRVEARAVLVAGHEHGVDDPLHVAARAAVEQVAEVDRQLRQRHRLVRQCRDRGGEAVDLLV